MLERWDLSESLEPLSFLDEVEPDDLADFVSEVFPSFLEELLAFAFVLLDLELEADGVEVDVLLLPLFDIDPLDDPLELEPDIEPIPLVLSVELDDVGVLDVLPEDMFDDWFVL